MGPSWIWQTMEEGDILWGQPAHSGSNSSRTFFESFFAEPAFVRSIGGLERAALSFEAIRRAPLEPLFTVRGIWGAMSPTRALDGVSMGKEAGVSSGRRSLESDKAAAGSRVVVEGSALKLAFVWRMVASAISDASGTAGKGVPSSLYLTLTRRVCGLIGSMSISGLDFVLDSFASITLVAIWTMCSLTFLSSSTNCCLVKGTFTDAIFADIAIRN